MKKLNALLSDINSKENPATTFCDVVEVMEDLGFESYTVNEFDIKINECKLKYVDNEWVVDFS